MSKGKAIVISDDDLDTERMSRESSQEPSDPIDYSQIPSRSRSRSQESPIPIPDTIPRIPSPVRAPPPCQTARMRVGPLGGLHPTGLGYQRDEGTSRDVNPYPLGHPMNRCAPPPPPASMLEKYSFDRMLREEMHRQHTRPRPRVFDEEGRRGLTQREIEGLNVMSVDMHAMMRRTTEQSSRIQDLGLDVMHVEILVNRALRSIKRFYYVLWVLGLVMLVVVARMF